MSSAYTIDAIDLSTPKEKTPIPSSMAAQVAGVYIIAAPGPASLHFGQGAQPVPVVQGKYYKCCPAEHDGIFVTNTQAAGFMLVLVTYEGGAIEVLGQDETAAAAVRAIYSKPAQAGSVNSGPLVQLWNPPTAAGFSPRNLVVQRIVAGSAVAGRASLAFLRRQLSNNGGGALTQGAARFMDRRLAPANPIVLVRDAGILGVIAGSTFDNLFWGELGATFQIPLTEELHSVTFTGGGGTANADMLQQGDEVTLAPGWGVAVQHSVAGAGTTMTAFFVARPE